MKHLKSLLLTIFAATIFTAYGQLQPVIFDSSKNTYRVVGEKVGDAWGSGKAIQEREVK